MIKKLFITISVVAFFGCANGTWNTGSAATNAALTAATSALSAELISAATNVAGGSDIKTALVQASGDAIRALEATGVQAIQPVVTEQMKKWLPQGEAWKTYAHKIGDLVGKYVKAHGNNNQTVNAALEATALTLNNY